MDKHPILTFQEKDRWSSTNAMNFTHKPSRVEKLIKIFQKLPQWLLDIVLVPTSIIFCVTIDKPCIMLNLKLSARGELGGRFLE